MIYRKGAWSADDGHLGLTATTKRWGFYYGNAKILELNRAKRLHFYVVLNKNSIRNFFFRFGISFL